MESGTGSASASGETLVSAFEQLSSGGQPERPSAPPPSAAASKPCAAPGVEEAGVPARTGAALSLVPLIRVAWVDGIMQRREREAILEAAARYGVHGETETYALLDRWLSVKPENLDRLFQAWADHVADLKQALPPMAMAALRTSVVDFTHMVAEAAGGMLSSGAVSEAERRVLLEVEAAFDRDD